MKTTIILQGNTDEITQLSKVITSHEFRTKTEAKRSIRNAYIQLCKSEPQLKGRIGGITIKQDSSAINYKQSSAIINNN